MVEMLEKLSQFAKKIEKHAPIKLSEREKRIVEEIEAQSRELSKLQEEFDAALDDVQTGATISTFGYEPIEEDRDNMSIERLAEVLRNESADNETMIETCRHFVVDNSSVVIQRVFRGHLGRKKFKVRHDIIWARKAEKTTIVLQAAYRGMIGRREAREFAEAAEEEVRRDASVQVQRMFRGNRNRQMVREMRAEVHKKDHEFFSTKGASEAALFKRRNNLVEEDEKDSSSESNSDDDAGTISTRHPTTGERLPGAPQYGKMLQETRRDYYYPETRRPEEDSFDADSSVGSDDPDDF